MRWASPLAVFFASCSATVLSCAFALNGGGSQLVTPIGRVPVWVPRRLKVVDVLQAKAVCVVTGKRFDRTLRSSTLMLDRPHGPRPHSRSQGFTVCVLIIGLGSRDRCNTVITSRRHRGSPGWRCSLAGERCPYGAVYKSCSTLGLLGAQGPHVRHHPLPVARAGCRSPRHSDQNTGWAFSPVGTTAMRLNALPLRRPASVGAAEQCRVFCVRGWHVRRWEALRPSWKSYYPSKLHFVADRTDVLHETVCFEVVSCI